MILLDSHSSFVVSYCIFSFNFFFFLYNLVRNKFVDLLTKTNKFTDSGFNWKIFFTSCELFTPILTCFFLHLNLNEGKSLQVSRTRLSILADLNSTNIWTVLVFPPVFPKTLTTVPSTSTTIYNFFSSFTRFKYLFIPWLSFIYTLFTQPLCPGRIWHKVNF